MCFTNPAYLREIRSGLASSGSLVHHFCLVASSETIQSRLKARGVDPNSDAGRWVYPRATQAGAVHQRPEFALQIATDRLTVAEVAEEICRRLPELTSSHA